MGAAVVQWNHVRSGGREITPKLTGLNPGHAQSDGRLGLYYVASFSL